MDTLTVDQQFNQIANHEMNREFEGMVGGLAVQQAVEAPAGMSGFDMHSFMAMNTQFDTLSADSPSTGHALASGQGMDALLGHNLTTGTLSADEALAEASRQTVVRQQQDNLNSAYGTFKRTEDDK
jgi:hypothetical protein